ncbi:MAG TPA: hypothetical protein VI248_07920 [Kineosporiaceae bacterium]
MQPAPTSIRQTTPVQLCLLLDQVPPSRASLPGVLPETRTGEAITILAGMIAQAAKPLITEAGDE